MRSLFACPCCGLATLEARGDFYICIVCWWEDDGQEDTNADQVLGGPNGRYSLSEARSNVRDHGHTYTEGEGIDDVEHPSPTRLRLLELALPAIRGEKRLDQARFLILLAKDRGALEVDIDDE